MNKRMQDFQSTNLPKFEKKIAEFLNNLSAETTLKDAMAYSVEIGGKRIRPLMIMAICSFYNRSIDDDVLAVAGSLEFLHTYSLIHDDLPEMDNDDLRRGKATNHKVFGQAEAVLAGDGLLTLAFDWVARTGLDSKSKVDLIAALAKAAGPEGMVSGQIADIEGEHKTLNLEQLKKVHERKTGALLRYACQAGGILCKTEKEELELLVNFGASFGLAFQIYDDILDVVSTTKEMGKAVHKDKGENKNTYPVILGLDGAYQRLEQAIEEAEGVLVKLNASDCVLADFLEYFKRKES
ncbi:polyprenyl synthetase family protein [Liquorilactobacillus mali]|uniref:polyprenyl synthetase family protein n=1 Tax=Liquorilactobacillus mali TaxID=1618 RepID=UPI002953F4A9|nr:farnesyl diphosphate synthase [Liquorilactobacillus mali]MDV7756992.1 polyprenyl synthetase family protein [Liquorilactobacillus mali]